MRVAFTSSDGRTIDRHFGQVSDFDVWEIGPAQAGFVGRVTAVTTGEDEEDRTAARASAVAGCALVYTVAIGGPPAAKLVARKIHPMKTGTEVPIAEVIAKLQEVLRGTPPPWLRKAMNAGAAPAADGRRSTGGGSPAQARAPAAQARRPVTPGGLRPCDAGGDGHAGG